MEIPRGIYGIVDVGVCRARGLDPARVGKAFYAANLPLIQLRAKNVSERETLELLTCLAEAEERADSLLIANDRVDLAVLSGADGVHLGQGDLPPERVKFRFPELIVGISTHRTEEFDAALASAVDYVAWGPVYPTANKKNPEPVVGEDSVFSVGALARGRMPLTVIGGIDEVRLRLLAPHVDHIAMIGALLPEGGADYERITERALALQRAFVAASE